MNATESNGKGREVLIACALFLLVVLPLSSADWPRFHNDENNSGYVGVTFTDSPMVEVLYTATGTLSATPVIADGTIYFGSSSGRFYAVNLSSGNASWNYTTNGTIIGSPAVASDYVITSTEDKIYVLNRTDGSLIGNFTTGNTIYAPVQFDAATIYIGSDDYKMYALDITNATLMWNYTTNDKIRSGAVYDTDYVYFANRNGTVYALNKTSGTLFWTQSLNYTIDSTPALDNELLYVGTYDGTVYALNRSSNGTIMWNVSLGGSAIRYSSPAYDSSTIYVGDIGGVMYAIDKTTQAVVWTYETGSSIESSPVITDNDVIFGSKNNVIYMLDKTDGSLISAYTTGSDVDSSAAYDDEYFYIASDDGKLYSVGPSQYPAISNIRNRSITSSSAVITFLTNKLSNATVEWGFAPYSYFWNASTSSFLTAHTFTIGGLPTSKTIYYRVSVTDTDGRTTQSAQYIFSTQPDTTPPSIVSITPANNTAYPSSTTAIPISFNTDKNASCRYKLYDASFNFSSDGTSIAANNTVHSFNYTSSSPINTTVLLFYIKCVNNYGNISSAYLERITIDSNDGIAPDISIRTPLNFTNDNQTTYFNISSNENLSAARILIGGTAYTMLAVENDSTQWYYSADLSPGNYTVSFTVWDLDNNVAQTENSWIRSTYEQPIVMVHPLSGEEITVPAYLLELTTPEDAFCYYNLEAEINRSLEYMIYNLSISDRYNATFSGPDTLHKVMLETVQGANYINIKCVYNSTNNSYYTRLYYIGNMEEESPPLPRDDDSIGMSDKLIYFDAGSNQSRTVNYEALVDIRVVLKRNTNPFTFFVREREDIPSSVFRDADGIVYTYIEINRSVIKNEDIDSGRLRFKVRKSWLKLHNLNQSNITLAKYSMGRWTELPTSFERATALHEYYVSNITSLSFFAITTRSPEYRPLVVLVNNSLGPGSTENIQQPPEENPLLEGITNEWLFVTIAVFLILIVIGLIGFMFIKDIGGVKSTMMRMLARRKLENDIKRISDPSRPKKSMEEKIEEKIVGKEAMRDAFKEIIDEERESLQMTEQKKRWSFLGLFGTTYQVSLSKDKEMDELLMLQRKIRQLKSETSQRTSFTKEEIKKNKRKHMLRRLIRPFSKKKDTLDYSAKVDQSMNKIYHNFTNADSFIGNAPTIKEKKRFRLIRWNG